MDTIPTCDALPEYALFSYRFFNRTVYYDLLNNTFLLGKLLIIEKYIINWHDFIIRNNLLFLL